ncbi:hypothetical protein BCR44DRAFT_25654 [Catenaria anguillulae PL171]|uniref:Uncharacterized protein n=1 Tax=Catenaria anguillulae PL171 TaxID=765915 RepID=A0A1Y2I538_9FUNG|nr:hypothetical protein BCR44DRAFT_25654 [Catenaria anguillulae PL171]
MTAPHAGTPPPPRKSPSLSGSYPHGRSANDRFQHATLAAIHRNQALAGYFQGPVDPLIDQVLNLGNESAQTASGALALQAQTDDEGLLIMTDTLLESSADVASDVWEHFFFRSIANFPNHIPLKLQQYEQPVDSQERGPSHKPVDHEQERLAGLRHLQPRIRRRIAALERRIYAMSEGLRIWSQLTLGSSNMQRALPNDGIFFFRPLAVPLIFADTHISFAIRCNILCTALAQVPATHIEYAKEPVPDANVGLNDPRHSAWLQEQLARALDLSTDAASAPGPHVFNFRPDSKWNVTDFTIEAPTNL